MNDQTIEKVLSKFNFQIAEDFVKYFKRDPRICLLKNCTRADLINKATTCLRQTLKSWEAGVGEATEIFPFTACIANGSLTLLLSIASAGELVPINTGTKAGKGTQLKRDLKIPPEVVHTHACICCKKEPGPNAVTKILNMNNTKVTTIKIKQCDTCERLQIFSFSHNTGLLKVACHTHRETSVLKIA